MRFFLDNCISPVMAESLGALARSQRIEVTHLADRFEQRDIPDVEWISAIRAEGWTIISGDTRILRSPAERAAWEESCLTAFFLTEPWMSCQFWVQAAELVRWFPIIIRTTRDCTPGSGFKLPFKGKEAKLVYNP